MNVEFAEVLCKSALLLRGERLPPEKQDLVFDQQFTEAVDGLPRQFVGERDAVNDGAEGGSQASNSDGHGDRLIRCLEAGSAEVTTLGGIMTAHAASLARA